MMERTGNPKEITMKNNLSIYDITTLVNNLMKNLDENPDNWTVIEDGEYSNLISKNGRIKFAYQENGIVNVETPMNKTEWTYTLSQDNASKVLNFIYYRNKENIISSDIFYEAVKSVVETVKNI
jgi:hypothetical protein